MAKYNDFDLDIQNVKVEITPQTGGWTSVYKCDTAWTVEDECNTAYCDFNTKDVCIASIEEEI